MNIVHKKHRTNRKDIKRNEQKRVAYISSTFQGVAKSFQKVLKSVNSPSLGTSLKVLVYVAEANVELPLMGSRFFKTSRPGDHVYPGSPCKGKLRSY